MKHGKEIIFYIIVIILVFIVIISVLRCRNTLGSLEQAFNDLQSAKDSIARIEQQFDKTGKIVRGLRGQLEIEQENYNKLEQNNKRLEAEYIKQREIYKEFRITNKSSQEAVSTISKLVEQSRIILKELLSECEVAEN
ncbi:unnamed protein product [marine sediment metagenome]|uniref:Uncharacterized protein n=1 Tax=marine sediment metagenome TaxID=412755 RepID=X0U5E1_9ZZZZ